MRISQSVSKLPLMKKGNQTFVGVISMKGQRASGYLVTEENKKLKKLVNLLRQNLSISDESLKKTLNDNSNMEYIASQNTKIKSLEHRLNESELKLSRATSKLEKFQQDLRKLSLEQTQLQEKADEYDVKAETYRVMKDKVLECLSRLFSDEPIKTLSLRFLELTNSFLPTLQTLLKKHPTIEIIDLEGNFISDTGAKILSNIILNTDINLQELNLSHNKLTIEGAWTLIKAVKQRDETKFKRIKKLSLLNNLIERPADIYVKINDFVKMFKDPLSPIKLKFNEARRPSYGNGGKSLNSGLLNLKEAQDYYEVLERVLLKEEEDAENDVVEVRNSEVARRTELNDEDEILSCPWDWEKYTDEKKKPRIISMYSTAGDLLTSTAENFVKNGGDVDGIDPILQETLLMHASRTGHARLMKKLVALGANLEVQNVIFTQKIGLNAFLVAVVHENYEILTFLSQCGCNIHASTTKGAKAIHLAVKEKKPQTICRLIELGLKVNSRDHHSKTPLHYAARIGDLDLGKLLIQLGAQLNPMDFKGRTPAGLAEEKENFNFADMLEALGGKKTKTSVRDNSIKDTLSVSSLQSLNDELSKELLNADKIYKKLYKNTEF